MFNAYTKEEIAAFVGARLKKFGTGAMNDPKLNSSFVEMISVLPPAFQVLFIESGHDSVVGDIEEINRAYRDIDTEKNHKEVAGFFSPGERQIDNFKLQSPSLIRRTATASFALRTARHEKGHDADYLIGKMSSKSGAPANFFSSLNKDWQAALSREIGQQSKRMGKTEKSPEEILNLSREEMTSLVAAYAKSEPLYDEYYPLLEHLSRYKTKEQRVLESFAEMYVHYTSLYAKLGGNLSSIDGRLSRYYPHLWPHFRDDVLPRIDIVAEELLVTRKRKMLIFVQGEESLCTKWHIPCDRWTSFKKASLALMDGTFYDRMQDFSRLDIFYANPIDNYAAAVQARDDLYYEYDTRSVGEIDDEKDRAEAHKIMTQQGLDSLGEAYLRVDAEKRSFERFVAAYHDLVKTVSSNFQVEDYYQIAMPNETAVSYFRKKYNEGGEAAINRHIDELPTEQSVAELYKVCFEMQSEVDRLGGRVVGTKVFQEDLARDVIKGLSEMIESRQYNAVYVQTEDLKEEKQGLHEYGQALSNLTRTLRSHVSSTVADITGPEILERFDKIMQQKGIEGIKEETKKIKILPSEIRGYVYAQLKFIDWSSAYALDGRAVPVIHDGTDIELLYPTTEFSLETYGRIASDIMDVVMKDGKEGVVRVKNECNDHIRAIKRKIQGVEDVPNAVKASGKVFAPQMQEAEPNKMLEMMRVVVQRVHNLK